MVHEQKTQTATEMQTAEMNIFKRLLQVGYTRGQANGLIDISKTLLTHKDITVNSDNPLTPGNPFTLNIRLKDVQSVTNALVAVKKNPKDVEQIVRQLDIKGPEKVGSVQAGTAQLTGNLCSVNIDGKVYTAQLEKPLAPKDLKLQLSDLLKTGGILQVTKFDALTGQDVAVTNSEFKEAYNRAFSEDPAKINVKTMKRG